MSNTYRPASVWKIVQPVPRITPGRPLELLKVAQPAKLRVARSRYPANLLNAITRVTDLFAEADEIGFELTIDANMIASLAALRAELAENVERTAKLREDRHAKVEAKRNRKAEVKARTARAKAAARQTPKRGQN